MMVGVPICKPGIESTVVDTFPSNTAAARRATGRARHADRNPQPFVVPLPTKSAPDFDAAASAAVRKILRTHDSRASLPFHRSDPHFKKTRDAIPLHPPRGGSCHRAWWSTISVFDPLANVPLGPSSGRRKLTVAPSTGLSGLVGDLDRDALGCSGTD